MCDVENINFVFSPLQCSYGKKSMENHLLENVPSFSNKLIKYYTKYLLYHSYLKSDLSKQIQTFLVIFLFPTDSIHFWQQKMNGILWYEF